MASVYFAGGVKPPAGPTGPVGSPASPKVPSENTKLLAQGKGPLKAPQVSKPAPPVNTEKLVPSMYARYKGLPDVQSSPYFAGQKPSMTVPERGGPTKVFYDKPKPGPSGFDAASQFNAEQQAEAAKAGVPQTAGIKALNVLGAGVAGAVHPLTDLLRGPSSIGGALSDVGNIGLNLVTPEKAGVAAGLFGLKGLRDVKAGVDVADVTQAAKEANATKAAYKLSQQHGIPLVQVTGTGRKGLVTANDVRFERFSRLQPQKQLQEGLKGSRSQYGVEKKLRGEETARRAQEVAKIQATVKDPREAMAATRVALSGAYPQIDYKGLKELNPETVKQLQMDVQNHPALGPISRHNVQVALERAVYEGRVPRPHELAMIERVFGKQTAAGFVKQATQGGFDKAINVANIPRALQTTFDVSGLMRQNLVAMVSHPVLGAKTLPVAFKAMRAGGFEAAQQAVKENQWYLPAVQAGVKFTDIGEHTSMLAHEEGFQSDIAANLLDKIPKVPNVIKGSARSYVATGNTMKMAAFENRMRIAAAAGDTSINNEETLKQIAQVINAATGRGTLPGRAEHLLPAMNTFLFSPRLMLARLQYLDPTWYFRLKGPARREALRGLFALAGSVTGALYLFSRIPGVQVNWSQPQNADWGKLKIHNTRIDIAGGFQQYVRLASEIAPNFLGGGYEVSSTTGKKTKLGSGFGIPTKWDVITQFGVNKLAPAPGFAVNVFRGHDAVGKPLTWKSVADNYLTPLTFQDAKDIYHEKHGGVDGITWALGGYGLGAVGFGLQTYAPKPPKASTSAPPSYFGSSSSGGGSSYFGSP